jgi:hypothetical protein
MNQNFYSLVIYSKKWLPHKDLLVNVNLHSCFIHNDQILERIQLPINLSMDKPIVLYTYKRLLQNKKKQGSNTCN